MLLTILLLVLGFVVLLMVIGWLLPREITIERAIGIDKPAEAIFPWIANLQTWPDWTIWNKQEDASLVYSYSGAAAGLGAAMSWTAKKMGDGMLTIHDAKPDRFIRYEMRMKDRSIVVHGNVELESVGGGATLVMWFDNINLGANPARRWLGLLLRPMMGKVFHRNLAGLRTAAETGKASGPGPK
ncbi:MAG TPA: SRPBCC family protein [Opitutaceae bacterium]|nr:SRPBCC family protein [Opitutaceae bacterium]